MSKFRQYVLLGMLLTSLTGCSAKPEVSPQVMQQTLLIKCPSTLPYDYGTEGSDWVLMAKEWSSIYHECATRHNGLIDVLNLK
jgi:hypothetical protein